MREIKLNGRERAILRAINDTGSTGEEIQETTHLEDDDLVPALEGLMTYGLVEGYLPNAQLQIADDKIEPKEFRAIRFEVNPAFAQEIRSALRANY